jgi:hypothetical protein
MVSIILIDSSRIQAGQSVCLLGDKVKFAALIIGSAGDGLYSLLHCVCDMEKDKFLHPCNKTRGQNHVLVTLPLAVCGNILLPEMLVDRICPSGAARQSA